MSCVPPVWGEASFLPLSCAGVVMSGRTTSAAPPDVAPAMMRIAWPLLFTKALMAGFGPRYAASRAPPNSASTAAGPALNTCVLSVVVLPSSLAKTPSPTPYTAVACVTLAKYPSRSSGAVAEPVAAALLVSVAGVSVFVVAHADARASAVMDRAKRRAVRFMVPSGGGPGDLLG